jgi:hypothetical protein
VEASRSSLQGRGVQVPMTDSDLSICANKRKLMKMDGEMVRREGKGGGKVYRERGAGRCGRKRMSRR